MIIYWYRFNIALSLIKNYHKVHQKHHLHHDTPSYFVVVFCCCCLKEGQIEKLKELSSDLKFMNAGRKQSVKYF
jgi:hypothetical protein